MTWTQILVLSLVQGITEFLPVSSSAHLILVPRVLGWPDQGLHFDVAANTGTLLAVVLYFRRDLGRLLAWPPVPLARWLVVGSLPLAVAGVLAYGLVATAARDPGVIAVTSIGFGLVLAWADLKGRRSRDLSALGWGDAVAVGLAQALALVPGTSRSGITLTAGLARGLDRESAARFSFLLAIPAGAMAAAGDLLAMAAAPPPPGQLSAMAVALGLSAVAAYLVIHGLLAWVRRQSLLPFVVYRVLLGLAILALAG